MHAFGEPASHTRQSLARSCCFASSLMAASGRSRPSCNDRHRAHCSRAAIRLKLAVCGLSAFGLEDAKADTEQAHFASGATEIEIEEGKSRE